MRNEKDFFNFCCGSRLRHLYVLLLVLLLCAGNALLGGSTASAADKTYFLVLRTITNNNADLLMGGVSAISEFNFTGYNHQGSEDNSDEHWQQNSRQLAKLKII